MLSLKNTNCGGTNGRNGTCYTEEECTTRGGINSGTCAGGYGICCVGKLVKHLQLKDYANMNMKHFKLDFILIWLTLTFFNVVNAVKVFFKNFFQTTLHFLKISVTITCGQTTSDNNSYMILSTSDTPTMPECSYKICGASKDICRIRFDFTKFVIADPNTGTATTTAPSTTVATQGYTIGHCHLDRFSISSMGNKGSPIICGTNTGQHSNDHFT